MPHVIFHLPNGQVISQTECQEGNEDLAFNPMTNLKIVVDEVPEEPIPRWRVIDGVLSVVGEEVEPDYTT